MAEAGSQAGVDQGGVLQGIGQGAGGGGVAEYFIILGNRDNDTEICTSADLRCYAFHLPSG